MKPMLGSSMHDWLTGIAAIITSIGSLLIALGVYRNNRHLKEIKKNGTKNAK